MKILVLGASGLIGNTLMRILSEEKTFNVYGTVRSFSSIQHLKVSPSKVLSEVDMHDDLKLSTIFELIHPDVVINCIGVTKHKKEGNDPIFAIKLNALFPHQLAQLCELTDTRLIHISSDCVFSGSKGNYVESDLPDACDIYGKSKALGEVLSGNSLTLRTSTIGHEMNTKFGLLDWFLSQSQTCKGFKKAIFSGLPTVSFARLIRDYVLPNMLLSGLYHVAAAPINKYDLFKLISNVYNKKINIQPDEDYIIDRSLDATKFNLATGYEPPDWELLIKTMHSYQ